MSFGRQTVAAEFGKREDAFFRVGSRRKGLKVNMVTVKVAGLAVEVAACVVYRAARIPRSNFCGHVGRVELSPAFVEGNPYGKGNAVV